MRSFRSNRPRNQATRGRSRLVNRAEAELNVVKSEIGQLRRGRANATRGRRVRRRTNNTRVGARSARRSNARSSARNRSGPTMIGRVLRTGGTIAGTYLGNPALGSAVGAGISRIFGQGDYTVTNNSLVQGGPPSFASLNTGMRVAHREYVQDVLGSVGWRNTTFQVTPTNASLFPWLSKLAYNFEEFKIHGLVFYFNTTCGNAISSTNNALGVVGMTTVYDPTDPDLASKREAEDYGGCVSGVPSCSLLHPVECLPRSNVLDRMYVQVMAVPDAEDLKFYSHGRLNVFTQGMQIDNVNIGELWVSYDIEFFNPKILPIGSVGAAASKVAALTGSQTDSQIFGTVDIPQTTGNLGAYYTGLDGKVNIPAGTSPGYYYLNWMASYTAPPTAAFGFSSFSGNVTSVNYFQGTSTNQINTPNASAANAWHGASLLFYKTNALAASIGMTRTAGSAVTGSVQFDLTVMKVPNALLGLPELINSPQERKDYNPHLGVLIDDLIASKLRDALHSFCPALHAIHESEESEESELEDVVQT